MGNNKKCFLLLLIATVFSTNVLLCQNHDFTALNKDYPLLMKRYGDRLESRSAHYVFAIDISSSMLEYEQVVKESLIKFIDAVPNGDQITIVIMSDENSTNYLDAAKCITLDGQLRQDMKRTIQSSSFIFKHQGDPSDGSDGFTMTKKVLEAMNVVNSSDLTFVYLLTDFEYWTHRNRYQKNNEDWASLKSLLTDKHKDMMCKYGIELTYNSVQHPEALFKNELDGIFGPLDYQTAASAAMLSQWFGHIINDIQAHKINAMLKADWKEYLDNFSVSMQNEGRELIAVINAPDCDLVSGMTLTVEDGQGSLALAKDAAAVSNGDTVWTVKAGRYESEPTIFPSYLRMDDSEAIVRVFFESPYAQEISKLQGLCQENVQSPDAVSFDKDCSAAIPAIKTWNAVLPLWVYILALMILLCILASIVYTQIIHPEKRYTSIVVKRRGGGTSKQINGETDRLPITIGDKKDVDVAGATWSLTIDAKKYNPIVTWLSFNKLKTGYYAFLNEGDYADIVNVFTDEITCTISKGKKALLFSFKDKKHPNSRIEISENTTNYTIEIN